MGSCAMMPSAPILQEAMLGEARTLCTSALESQKGSGVQIVHPPCSFAQSVPRLLLLLCSAVVLIWE